MSNATFHSFPPGIAMRYSEAVNRAIMECVWISITTPKWVADITVFLPTHAAGVDISVYPGGWYEGTETGLRLNACAIDQVPDQTEAVLGFPDKLREYLASLPHCPIAY